MCGYIYIYIYVYIYICMYIYIYVHIDRLMELGTSGRAVGPVPETLCGTIYGTAQTAKPEPFQTRHQILNPKAVPGGSSYLRAGYIQLFLP